jgi:type II secretory pathway predicted ATPase ExeA
MNTSFAQHLKRTGFSLAAFARRVGLSRPALSALANHGIRPACQPNLEGRMREALVSAGMSAEEAAVALAAIPENQKPRPCANTDRASPEADTTQPQEDSMLLRSETLSAQAKKQFGLLRSPFADDIHTRADVFASPNTRYVRAQLLDCALNHGFLAIVGESGAGKSVLADELEQRILDEGRPVIVIRPYTVAMEENDQKGKTLKAATIAEAVIHALDPSCHVKRSPQARFQQLHDLLKASRAAGNSHLLLIEEAHGLPTPTLKHLKRYLEQFKQGLSRLIGICLIAQPELMKRLSEQNAELREVVQRLEVIHLPPLDNDLEAYLAHKFERAGIKVGEVLAPDVPDAIRARLIRLPRGGRASEAQSLCYPLVVGNLITRAMNAAASAGWEKVDAQVIGGI